MVGGGAKRAAPLDSEIGSDLVKLLLHLLGVQVGERVCPSSQPAFPLSSYPYAYLPTQKGLKIWGLGRV